MKKILILTMLVITQIACFGQDVEEEELTSVQLGSVEFLNYEGPRSKIETIDEITGIGRYLGENAAADITYAGKYRIIRAVDQNTPLLNADIFVINENALVDHIDNIRRMVAGYLSAAHGYSSGDAALLAEFCTYYNAVYRGKIDYFSSKYHDGVLNHITTVNAGIATSYEDWPGKTRMLIPLQPTGERIDADVISDEAVIGTLREEEDKGIPERKDLVEFKEKELEEDQRQIDERREALAEEEAEVAEAEDALEEDRAQLEEQRDELPEETVEQQETEIAQQEEEIEERRDNIQEERRSIEEAEEAQRERVERIQEERAQIAQDQQEVIEEQSGQTAAAVVQGREVLFLKKNSTASDSPGTLVFLNSATGRETKSSPITTVHSPSIQFFGEDILVVAGEEGGNRAIRLALINPLTLEMSEQGDTDMYPRSYILVDNNAIYGVIKEGPGFRIGKFDRALGRTASSTVTVIPNTWMKIEGEVLFVQSESGILSLDAGTLLEAE